METLPALQAPTQYPFVVEAGEQRVSGDWKQRFRFVFSTPSVTKMAREVALSVIAGLIVMQVQQALPKFSRAAPQSASLAKTSMSVTLPPMGSAENDLFIRAALSMVPAQATTQRIGAPPWPPINMKAVDLAPPRRHKESAGSAPQPPPRSSFFGHAPNLMKGMPIEQAAHRLALLPPPAATSLPVNSITPSAQAETAVPLVTDRTPAEVTKPSAALKPLSDGIDLAIGAGTFAVTTDEWLIFGAPERLFQHSRHSFVAQ
ncbi:hypothetical protein CCR94_18580 [Rhodoblastus sphagnicola]|uniref:Uncharacterized protein n=1 Tax=Rhodoblastus sphagnicola TaxID=333368 RepID=A0A2S6N0N2_9HYPH|nr:hypothetical protein [Rhodoblastus sphagnicola]MBB4200458.1 hypothetical protein [Rhodoblastus sphagnicola]PPQ28185.1 hypothetical protein CCR94_18580 [Rhodoblastus sphagnicola]